VSNNQFLRGILTQTGGRGKLVTVKERCIVKGIKIILAGIVLLLASLFFMGICIINIKEGGPQGLTLALFVIGLLVSGFGLFYKE